MHEMHIIVTDVPGVCQSVTKLVCLSVCYAASLVRCSVLIRLNGWRVSVSESYSTLYRSFLGRFVQVR